MARTDFVERVRTILYGTGLGERPAIRRAAANANEAVTGSVLTFDMLAGEGAKLSAGDVLSVKDDTAAATAFAVYVLSVSTDAVTAENATDGTAAVAGSDSGDLDSVLFEQNPLVTTYKIHQAIDTIIDTSLWSRGVYKYAVSTVTPNLATGQTNLAGTEMKVVDAYQKIGSEIISIPFSIKRNVHTTLAASTVLGNYDPVDGSTIYLTSVAKMAIGDETTYPAMIEIVATGAAALCLGSTVSETQLERTGKDNQERGQRDVSQSLWRDFLTLTANYSAELAEDRSGIRVDRG